MTLAIRKRRIGVTKVKGRKYKNKKRKARVRPRSSAREGETDWRARWYWNLRNILRASDANLIFLRSKEKLRDGIKINGNHRAGEGKFPLRSLDQKQKRDLFLNIDSMEKSCYQDQSRTRRRRSKTRRCLLTLLERDISSNTASEDRIY
jgi:hypothetical protein